MWHVFPHIRFRISKPESQNPNLVFISFFNFRINGYLRISWPFHRKRSKHHTNNRVSFSQNDLFIFTVSYKKTQHKQDTHVSLQSSIPSSSVFVQIYIFLSDACSFCLSVSILLPRFQYEYMFRIRKFNENHLHWTNQFAATKNRCGCNDDRLWISSSSSSLSVLSIGLLLSPNMIPTSFYQKSHSFVISCCCIPQNLFTATVVYQSSANSLK